MTRFSRLNLQVQAWNMEMLSQIGLIENFGEERQIVLNEEGFVQRLAASFLALTDSAELGEATSSLPNGVMNIAINVPFETSLFRARQRRKGIPSAFKAATDTEIIQKLASFDRILREITTAQKAKGCAVLDLDGESPDQLEIALAWILEHIPPKFQLA
jgi:hypothetical protein